MILPGTRNPEFDLWLKGLTKYRFDELWTGKVPKECRAIWNQMSTAWKVKMTGWGDDAQWIEQAIRARCRDFLISARSIEHIRGIDTLEGAPRLMVPPACYYVCRVTPITGAGAFAGFSLAAGALISGLYWSGAFGNPYGDATKPHVWIEPTIMVNDNMDTAKEPKLIPSDPTVQFQLIPGAGLAGSKALRITFEHTYQDKWRHAKIRYRFPGPLRQFVLFGFNLKQHPGLPLTAAEFFVRYSEQRERRWAGFRYSAKELKYPWSLIEPRRPGILLGDPETKPIGPEYSPTWCEFDTVNLEYSKLNTFGQIHNVKGYAFLTQPHPQPLPCELDLILYNAFRDEMILDLDAVLVYEYGPYRSNIEAELHTRIKDMPIQEKLPSALS